MIRSLVSVLVCTTLYTIIRYVVCGPVSLIHVPVYLLNKSVSMASVVLFFLSALQYRKGRLEDAKFLGMASFHCAGVHILLSLSILSAAYYPKFFGADKMNLSGEAMLLFGILAAYCYLFVCKIRKGFFSEKAFRFLVGLFLSGHLVAMGWSGWLTPAKWHGGLPPISLVSFAFVAASVILFTCSGRRNDPLL